MILAFFFFFFFHGACFPVAGVPVAEPLGFCPVVFSFQDPSHPSFPFSSPSHLLLREVDQSTQCFLFIEVNPSIHYIAVSAVLPPANHLLGSGPS